MIKTKITTILIVIFFTSYQTYSQSDTDTSTLFSILNQVQEKFNCRFTYVDEDIEGIQIQNPSDTLDLKKTIEYLRSNTPLAYTFLNEKDIALSRKIKKNKICGVIQSLIDNKILASATIQTKTDSTISDENGTFSLIIENSKTLIKINYIGYKTLLIPAKDLLKTPCTVIYLTPEVQYLTEVILNDYLVKGIDKKSDGSIIIDYNDFGILPGLIEPDLLQTIQALPGILSVEETVSDINVRGGTNDQNLILWDGIKMYQSGHFFGLISAFNPYLTKNVQLIKNGTSATYGDGVSSVIAMSTTNEINQTLDASLGINMISADAYIDTPLGKRSSLQLSVRKSISELVETPTYSQFFDKVFQDSEVVNTTENIFNTDDEFSFYDASLRWLYQLSPKDLLKINALIIRNNLIFQENTLIDQINITRESSIKQNNSAAGISYQRNWNDSFKSEVLIYGTNYGLEAINSDIINDQRLLQENEVLENGIKVNNLLKLNRHFNLKTGYQFNETGISNLRDVNNPTFRDLTKEVIRTNSIFSEIEYKSKNNNTHLNLGARINHFDKLNDYVFEPRISFNHRFYNHFTIEALGELKSQVTSQIIESQNDFLGVENRKWVLSNEQNIPVLKSKQISLGLSYNHNNWLISSELYYKNVDGIITQSQGFQNQFEFSQDHGSYTVKGIDFLINKRFKSFSTWFSYSYGKSDYTFNNLFEIDFPNNIDITHNINLAVTYTLEKLKLSSGLNWHSGKPTTRPIPGNEIESNIINYQDPNSDTLDDYIRWDASATYNFKLGKKITGLAGISIWNILSKKNTVNDYYKINSENNVEEIKEFGLGFTPNAVVRINF
ncbi:TonB-dependent receptor plug domain-containing protein [Aquimarina mytili]|uniref:TonB-dependent receptor n=1 Tax=Aquimarina mytili TaxID=874423 RepID=A0A936ZZE2_9FLAO|nr:TonB-dependent receptor [Aquimarina mytili]MBL0685176.1 TonB-dependent receptor [Aquimarina mytili]